MPLTGSLWGRSLALEKVVVNDHAITFITTRTVGKRWPDPEVILFVGKDEPADKVVTPADAGMPPHVHLQAIRCREKAAAKQALAWPRPSP